MVGINFHTRDWKALAYRFLKENGQIFTILLKATFERIIYRSYFIVMLVIF